MDRDSYALNAALDRLEAEGEYERAAAIALFNLKIRRAILALNKGSVTARAQGKVASVFIWVCIVKPTRV